MGRLKIKNYLKLKGVSEYCIRKGMQEIEEGDYEDTLSELMDKKWKELKERNILVRKNKLSKYLIGKGYEPDLVWERINQKFKDK